MKIAIKKIIWMSMVSVGILFLLLGILIINSSTAGPLVLFVGGSALIFFGLRQRKKLFERKKLDEALRAERSAQADHDAKFGNFDFKITGVTFDNDDGSSRQKIIKNASRALAVGDEFDMTFEQDEYNGKPRVFVLLNGKIAGCVEADKVDTFIKIADKITKGRPEIGTIEDDTGEVVYFCHVYLVYNKE